nr:hypothetical protein [uncultured Eisenbergiella sp.]
MITLEYLDELKKVDIKEVDINSLVDIRDVKVNLHLKQPERIMDYIDQIKNPYCFRHGGYIVKIGFCDSGKSLNDCLKSYVEQVTRGQIGETALI